jgi:Rrf2 family nitric oxide-sensitive transcriptional repressor
MHVMQLTKFTDLSLRVLMYLTQHDRLQPVTINEIAQQFSVPRNHLIKVVTRLNKLGWVFAMRGRHGGLRLGLEANQLKLGNIIFELENTSTLIDCGKPPCALKGQCHLKEILDDALNVFYAHMNTFSLADVVNQQTQSAVISMHQRYQVFLSTQAT